MDMVGAIIMGCLQDKICEWAIETFGPQAQRLEGVFAHFEREVSELEASLPDIDPDELADCAMFLFELAGFAGVDLLVEVEKKFVINQERKWGPLQPDGSILHIKDET